VSNRHFVVLAAAVAIGIHAASLTRADEPAITTYGERNAQAPAELEGFSFLVGKWSGGGRTRLEDGSYVDWQGATWIGRYILDGMAIADELHAPLPGGGMGLGITVRHFDTSRDSWIVEFLNVTNSFLRRQVNPRSGRVTKEGNAVAVVGEDAQMHFRETYRVLDRSHFTYTAHASLDGGRTWGPVLFEMSFARVE
jgi:hypothetical protein